MSSELSLYKGKVSALESALKQQKSQAEKPMEKPMEKRFDIPADLKRRVSLDEKIIPVQIFQISTFNFVFLGKDC